MTEDIVSGEGDLPTRGVALPIPKYSDGGGWRDAALCKTEGNALFFAQMERGGDIKSFQAQVELAKLVCAECPVRIECLNYALRNDTTYGVWGGVNMRTLKGTERKALLSHLKVSA